MTQFLNNPYCQSEQKGGILLLRLNYCLFLESKTYEYRDALIDMLDKVSKDETIKSVVISNDHPDFSLESYQKVWHAFFEDKNYEEKVLRSFRVFDLLVLKLYALKKVVVSMLVQPMNAFLFNFSFIADLRIVSKDFYLDNDNVDMVNIPKGSTMHKQFINATINPVNVYFLSDKIFPDVLSKHNMVDRVFNPEELNERTESLVQRFEEVHYAEIEAAKMAKSADNLEGFENLLQQENTFLLSCIREKFNESSQKIQRFQ